MPYNPDDQKTSWDLLKWHSKQPNSWTSTALSAEGDESIDGVEVVVCVPGSDENAHATPKRKNFVCRLQPDEILVLMKNSSKSPKYAIASISTDGKTNATMLIGGEITRRVLINEPIGPAISKSWRHKPVSFLPVILKIDKKTAKQDFVKVKVDVAVREKKEAERQMALLSRRKVQSFKPNEIDLFASASNRMEEM